MCDFERLPVTIEAIDGDGKAVTSQAPCDDLAQPSRATCHQCDALLSHKQSLRSAPAAAT
jgi:hypothetical protein